MGRRPDRGVPQPADDDPGAEFDCGGDFVWTEDPAFEPEGAARVSVGNYRTRQVSAMLSGPVTGDVAVRAAGDFRYARTTSRITDRIEGGDPNHDVYGLARVKLLVKPRGAPDTRLLVTYTHNQSQKPQILGLTPPFKVRRDTSGLYGTFRVNVDALTANLRQQVTPSLATDVTVTGGDSSAQRLAPANFGEARNKGRDWSAEGVLNWTPGGAVHAVGGGQPDACEAEAVHQPVAARGSIGRFRDEQDSFGVFGERT